MINELNWLYEMIKAIMKWLKNKTDYEMII